MFALERVKFPFRLGVVSPSFIAVHYRRIIQFSVTYFYDVSIKGLLSFTHPIFASPGSPVWLGFPLGFSSSFARVVAEPARARWRRS